MRVRTLVAVAAALALGAAAPASAAPPVGCYGLPDIPDAFLCITSFTPTNAVPSVDTSGGTAVTIPRFCAGDCYGPLTVPVPGASLEPGDGPVMTFVYKGQTYPITVGEIPDVPDLVPDLSNTDCGTSWWDYPYYQEVQGIGAYPAACVWLNPDGSATVQTCAAQLAGGRCTTRNTPPVEFERLLGTVSCLMVGDDTFQLSDVTGCL